MRNFYFGILFFAAVGCAHVKIVRDELAPTTPPAKTYKIHSFLWAFLPGRQLPPQNVLCANSRIETLDFRMSPVDVLMTSATLGIYVPHRVTVVCANVVSPTP